MVRRLIVCCDGTWNTPETDEPTNVVKIAQVIPRGTADAEHIVYYDEGIGTQNLMDKWLGGAFGEGLDLNIRQAYRFLALNHREGDQILLFGYSRGAYTVRSLAAMIATSGLLDRAQITAVHHAYENYRNHRDNDDQASAFRHTYQTTVPTIHFLGCWDTVQALGIPDQSEWITLSEKLRRRYQFINTRIGAHIQHAAHAVAIDEQRKAFDVSLMQPAIGRAPEQVTEYWFPGDHGCVGGGSRYKRGLSDTALHWIAEQATRHTGLVTDFTLLPDGRHQDHTAFFHAVTQRATRRHIPPNARFHPSALQRFVDLPDYPAALNDAQRRQLGSAAANTTPSLNLASSDAPVTLSPGEHRHLIVHAKPRTNNSHVRLEQHGHYRISVGRSQFWQDDDIHCDAKGWSTTSHHAQLNALQHTGLRWIERLSVKVVNDANWMELIGVIDTADTHLRIGDGLTPDRQTGRYHFNFIADHTGLFHAFANDAATLVGDTYGNNSGWLVINIERLA